MYNFSLTILFILIFIYIYLLIEYVILYIFVQIFLLFCVVMSTSLHLIQFVQIGQALSTVAMAVSSVSSLVETWKGVMEGSVEPLDAVKQTLTTLGFVIPMLITSFNSLNMAEYGSVVASIAAALGFTGTATAAEAAAAGTATFGTVLYTVLWPIGLVMVAIGLLIGVVWLLVKAFQANQ